jgi:glycosyltransferase involved in cell wall biosynthesis
LENNQKILIVTECFYPEEFKINDVALGWIEKGYEVDVLTLVPTYPQGKVFAGYKNKLIYQKDMYEDINVYRIRGITGYRDSLFKKILRYINFMILGTIIAIFIGKKYDYVFGWNGGALTDMLPAIIIHKVYKKPTMLWVQDVWPDSVYAYGFKKTKILSKLLDIFVKFIYSNITSIAVSSKGFEEKLKPYVKDDLRFNYAPNWADDLDLNMKPADIGSKEKIHFTFAGNIGKVQNLENIIMAFTRLSVEYQNKAQLNIIGDGSNLDNLKKIANLNSNIIFHGKKDRSDMGSYYQASDFLIISLINKPIFEVTVPAKTQTYIAAKKPILALINGDVANIVKDNNLGICAEPSNINKIKEAFKRCIDMPDSQRSKFLINNDHLLKTTFNKEVIIDELKKKLIE